MADTNSDDCKKALEEAIALHQENKLPAAETRYQDVLKLNAEHPDALHLLGVLSHQRGDSARAIELIGRSLAVSPEQPRVFNNLGNIQSEQGNFDEAAKAYQQAIEFAPDYAPAHLHLGHSLQEQGQADQAMIAYERARALDPEDAGALLAIGGLYQTTGRWDDAMETYREVIALDPDVMPAYRSLAALLRKVGRLEEARQVYDDLLEIFPIDPVAQHLRAACDEEAGPPRASDAYVRATFDGFADNFDECLADLGYRAPEMMVEALARHRAYLPERDLDVLDAGCGTGLCAAKGLKDGTRQLVGVDLSSKMVEKARERGGYDELLVEELTSYLSQQDGALDAIVSADTVVYFGDLAPLMTAAAEALRAPGLLLFTVEKLSARATDGPDTDPTSLQYRINRTGRFEHSEDYLRKTLVDAGLELVEFVETELRTEGGDPVTGLLVVASKT